MDKMPQPTSKQGGQLQERGRPLHPEATIVKSKMSRLSWFSVFALVFALMWASYGFKQESARAATSPFPDLYEASIAELQQGLEKGLFTSVDLVKVRSVTLSHQVHALTDLHLMFRSGVLCENRGSKPPRSHIASCHRDES